MLIIYNLPGLLVGIAGLVCGFAVLLASGSVGAGLCGVAAAWFGLGLWWRRRPVGDPGGGRAKRAWPALFFVPLPFLAVPLAALGLAAAVFQSNRDARPPDPRAEAFRADEARLDEAPATGDADLSRRVLAALRDATVEAAGAEDYSAFTRRRPGAVLVLLKAPNLKTYGDAAREELVEGVAEIVAAETPDDPPGVYVGVKGRTLFGAVRTPTGGVRTGRVVPPAPLHAFYDAPPRRVDSPPPTDDVPPPTDDPPVAAVPPRPRETLRPPTRPERSPPRPDRFGRDSGAPPADPREVVAEFDGTNGFFEPDGYMAELERDLTGRDGYVAGSVRVDWDAGTVTASVAPDSWAERTFRSAPMRAGLTPALRGAPAPPAGADPAGDGPGDYAGPWSVPATGRPVPAETELVPGAVLQAARGSTWYPVTVAGVADDGAITVRWNGRGEREETLPRTRLAFPPPNVAQPSGFTVP